MKMRTPPIHTRARTHTHTHTHARTHARAQVVDERDALERRALEAEAAAERLAQERSSLASSPPPSPAVIGRSADDLGGVQVGAPVGVAPFSPVLQ